MFIKKSAERKIILTIFLLALCFLYIGSLEEHKRFNKLVPFEMGWKLKEENVSMPFDMETKEGGVYIVSNILPSSFSNSKAIVFKSENLYWKVFVDGVLVESYQSEDLTTGLTPGDLWNVVIIPDGSDGKEIQIQMEVEFEKGSNLLRTVHYAPLDVAITEVVMQGVFGLIICIMIFLLSLIYILLEIFVLHKQDGKYALLFWALFSIALSFWSMGQTTIVHMLLGNGVIIRMLSYIMLPLVLAFGALFLQRNSSKRVQKYGIIFAGICIVWGAVVMILDCTKMVSYVKTVSFTQYLIIFVLIYIFLQLINSLKHYKKLEFNEKIYIFGNAALLTMAAWDTFSCYTLGVEDYSKNTRIALLFYSVCVGIDFFIQFIENMKLAEKSKIMEKLAYVDGLTGIENRMAFEEYIKNAVENKVDKITIIQMDVNNLKKMNDIYGHIEGDNLLKKVADTIKEVFSQGQCFRYGGDEFILAIPSNDKISIEEAIKFFEKRENEINSKKELKIPMSVACGYAILENNSTIFDTIKKADEEMYRSKKKMKNEI